MPQALLGWGISCKALQLCVWLCALIGSYRSVGNLRTEMLAAFALIACSARPLELDGAECGGATKELWAMMPFLVAKVFQRDGLSWKGSFASNGGEY